MIIFSQLTLNDDQNQRYLIHNQNAIVVGYRLQSVSYGQHSTIPESLLNFSLNELIGLEIHIGGGFIEHNYFVVLQHGPCQTNELLLTDTKHTGRYGHISL